MNEAEWMACDDPGEMEFYVGERLSDRKLRLFGCGCVRGVWEVLPDDALRQTIAICERFADGLATAKELRAARKLADGTYRGMGDIIADHSAIVVEALCRPRPWFPMGEGSAAGIAAVAAEAWFTDEIPWDVARAKAKLSHSQLLRDILGNPFRPSSLARTRLRARVLRLAEATYEEREHPSGHLDNTRLGILADALEEAGCANADILAHCRGPGPHVRGCWVVDLLLGKS